jgi:hypothetical protein
MANIIKPKEEIKEKSENANWFYTGSEGLERKRQQDTVAKLKREKQVFRFSLKPNEEATIVFVDSVGFYCYVHQVSIGGNWGNFITCTKDFAVCPVCEKGLKSVFTAHYTVIDTRSFTRQDGTVVQNKKVLYPAKGSTINRVADLIKQYGSLEGRTFKVKRYDKNEPNCGTSFEHLGKIALSKKFGEDAAIPIDYNKVLAVPLPEELEALGFGGTIITGSDADIEDLGILDYIS